MKVIHKDVVVIGSGISGLMCSIRAKERGLNVLVVSKEPISWGNTRISGGIIASNEFDKQLFIEDVLNAGRKINQFDLVDLIINKLPNEVETLEQWGHTFLRSKNEPDKKEYVQPGGHSEPRTLKALNRGISISNTLKQKFISLDIDVLEEVLAVNVLVQEKQIAGVLCYDWKNDEWFGVNAGAVVLACGGAGMIYYPHTDNMRSATGDGYALGLRAGAKLIDMEQIQFIPFGIVSPRGMRGLEVGDTSAAGPYGKLVNQKGEVIEDRPFNKTREEISRLIAIEIEKGNGTPNGGIWLDPTENLEHKDGMENWHHWRSIGTTDTIRNAYGVKASKWEEKYEVSPTQHYVMGGLHVNTFGETQIQGLYAVGENASGFHGAGRIGSMSLFEALTFSAHVGNNIRLRGKKMTLTKPDYINERDKMMTAYEGVNEAHPVVLKKELGMMMWQYCGVIRSEEKNETLLHGIHELEESVKKMKVNFHGNNDFFLHLFELESMLLTSKAVAISSLMRKESRGSHYRSDFPSENLWWENKNIIVFNEGDELKAELMPNEQHYDLRQ